MPSSKPSSASSFPPRPYLPPSAAGALAAAVTAALTMQVGWRIVISPDGAVACTVVALVVVFVIVGILVIVRQVVLAFCGGTGLGAGVARSLRWVLWSMLIACCASCAIIAVRLVRLDELKTTPVSSLELVVSGDERRNAFGMQVRARAYRDGRSLGDVMLSLDDSLDGAVHLRAVGRVEPWKDDPWDQRQFFGGALAEVKVVRVLEACGTRADPISGLRDRALSVIDPATSDARALVAGIVCGRTTELSASDASNWFSTTGTSHLVAVSGGHLALVSSLLTWLLIRLRVNVRGRLLALCALSAAYVIFTGAAASAVRSLIMVAAALVPQAAGRRPHGLSGLSLTVIVMAVTNPGVVYDLGFQLSVASVLSLLLFGTYLGWHLESWGIPRAAAEPLSLTLSAQAATLPITIPVFGEVSLIAPVANLVLGPVMSALLVAGILIVPLRMAIPDGLEVLGAVLMAPLDLLAGLSLFAADVLSRLPGASIIIDPGSTGKILAIVLVVLLIALYISWVRLPRRVVAMLLATFAVLWTVRYVQARYFAPAEVVVLDVGQGDAILVREGAQALLVDCGVDEAAAIALSRNGAYHLDAVVITHWDSDHWGGLPEVLDTVAVDRLVVARGSAASAPPEAQELDLPAVTELCFGDRFSIGGFSCTMIWPREPVVGEENAESLVLDVDYERGDNELSVLLTGDSEIDQARVYATDVGETDVLKLGHHGSASSVDVDLLRVLDPSLAVASAGEGNRYGHPSDEATDCLEDAGIPFLCTIESGDIHLKPDDGSFSVACQR